VVTGHETGKKQKKIRESSGIGVECQTAGGQLAPGQERGHQKNREGGRVNSALKKGCITGPWAQQNFRGEKENRKNHRLKSSFRKGNAGDFHGR